MRGLCIKSREIFLSQPILLELEAPLKICGQYLLVKSPLWSPAGVVAAHRLLSVPQVTSTDSTQTC